MRGRFASISAGFVCAALFASSLLAQAPAPTPDENPTGNTGALKEQIQTACSYDAHSGNATRIANDLHTPGALGVYGLDFTRYWNSLHPEFDNPNAEWPAEFGASGWSHSWRWSAVEGTDTWQLAEGGGPQGTQYWETSITIGFPDGHSTKYKIIRANRSYQGQPPGCGGRIGWGPPYLDQCGEKNWPPPGWLHDRLCDMAQDGSEFWLHLADGGSVHFTGGPGVYQATEVFDPHGLRTELQYGVDGYLLKVLQDGGRWLDITWEYRENFSVPVITKVQSGGYAGVQTVTYNYNRYPPPNGGFLVLTSVDYPDDRAPGQLSSAIYTYGSTYTDDGPNAGVQAPYPLLKIANDPRYPGAMTTIRYDYYGGTCPPPNAPPDTPPPDYYWRFYPQAEAIAAEKSGDTAIPVSSFANFCASATRQETNGFGAVRKFFFGGSGGQQGSYGCTGYQLAKVTDFYTGTPNNVPFEFQNFLSGQPRQVWDGRNILTDLVLTPGDDSGQPGEIHHTGSGDGSAHYYDRVNAGASEAPDTSRIHNPFNHWLFSQRDERNLTTTYVRDSRRRVKDIIYPVTAEHFAYNDFNQVTSHTLPSGAVQTYEYDETTHRLIREYNSVDGPEARKEYTYYLPGEAGGTPDLVKTASDGRSRSSGAPYSTRMEYNGRHQILKVHYAPTSGSSDPHVSYEYDAYGNCTSITDEMGHASTYTYDSYRRCTSYTEPLNAPDAWDNNMPSRRWDWGYDRVIVNPDGTSNYFPDSYLHTKNEWRWQLGPAYNYLGDRPAIDRGHDAQNRVTWERTGWILTASNGWSWSSPGETVYYTYDENGQKKSYTDPLSRLTTYDYDLRNRLWKTNETVNTVPRTTETLYDVAGNKTMVKFPVEAAGQRTQQWLDYDAFGQPGRFIDERGNTTNLAYWWGPMKKLGMVTTHRDKDGGGTEDQVTVFSYDLVGRSTNVWFPDGSYPSGSHEDSTYEFGQLKTWRTRKGQTKTINYDARGREISHTWDDGQTPAVYRAWDDASRMTSIWNAVATLQYGYDDAAQLLSESESISGAGGAAVTGYRRYDNGTLWNVIYPNGMRSARAYSPQVRLQTVWDHGPNSWQMTINYTYTGDGKIDHADYGNGVSSNYGYDQRGFLNSVFHHRGWPYQTLSARTYWRDERDRITAYQKSTDNSVNPMEDGRGNHYQYDAESQLTDAWYDAVDPAGSYSSCLRQDHFYYDALGNRRSWNYVQTHGWQEFSRKDNGLNEYRMWSPFSMTNYDDDLSGWGTPGHANGVLMQDGNITAGYNALNQPMLATSNALSPYWMFFGYDPLGRCVKRWIGGLTPEGNVPPPGGNPATYLYYDGWNLIQEGPSSTDAQRQYVHGARVDEIVAQITPGNGTERYFHYDASGNCILQTYSGSGIAEQYEYDAFGYPYFFDASGTNIGYSPWGNRFLFTGREYLKELKLYDYRNRLYQPELGRFMQPDPKEFGAGDYNLYRYCHNDPINKSDPMGLYVSGLTSWGGGDWIRGMNGITNRDKDLINQARLHDFLYSEKTAKVARDAADASHSTGVEHGAAFGNNGPNDIALGPTTAATDDPEKNVGGRHGVFNTTDFARKPLPPGFMLRGGVWGIVRHQGSWPTGDRRGLWELHTSGVLGIPAQDGSQNRRPDVLVYEYVPGSAAPPLDN